MKTINYIHNQINIYTDVFLLLTLLGFSIYLYCLCNHYFTYRTKVNEFEAKETRRAKERTYQSVMENITYIEVKY